jgi:phage shock protein PspC (stress-responsive transcriptional regulator)
MASEHLTRSNDDRIIAGVAGGLARYLDIDPLLVRLGFVLLTISFGAGILAYIAAIIVIPEDKEELMDEQQPTPGTPEATNTGAGPVTEPAPASATVASSSPSNPFLAPTVSAPPTPPDSPPADAPSSVAAPPAVSAPAEVPPEQPLPPVTPPLPPAQPQPHPSHPETHDEEHHRRRTAFGVVLICVGILFLIQQFVPAFDWGRFWPVLLVGLGAYILLRERD